MRQWLTMVALLVLLAANPGHAQEGNPVPIHRCTNAQGQAVYTDRDCADVQAVPALPAASRSSQVMDETAAATATASAPTPILCATDIEQLKQAIVDAFAARDTNRLTGLMLWSGYGKNSLIGNVRMLASLMAHPLLSIDIAHEGQVDDPDVSAGVLDPPPSTLRQASVPDALILHTGSADGTDTDTRFGVIARSGCLWLRPL